jgi:hypothetical protein
VTLSEMDYYLIQELVEMPDRQLASMIELCSFPTSCVPKHWNKFVEAIEESKDPDDFYRLAREVIKNLGAKFAVSEAYWHQAQDDVRQKLLENNIISSPLSHSGNNVVLLNAPEL